MGRAAGPVEWEEGNELGAGSASTWPGKEKCGGRAPFGRLKVERKRIDDVIINVYIIAGERV